MMVDSTKICTALAENLLYWQVFTRPEKKDIAPATLVR